MGSKAKMHNWENHKRQKKFLQDGIVMIPSKPIREKSREKQLKAAIMKLRADGTMRPKRKPAKA